MMASRMIWTVLCMRLGPVEFFSGGEDSEESGEGPHGVGDGSDADIVIYVMG